MTALRYSAHGTGIPIIFVHGWRLDATTEECDYEGHIEALLAWQRIYLDFPGMGRADADPALRSLTDYRDWLVRAIKELCPDGSPYLLAGTSTGAALALAAVLQDESNLQGLLLRAPQMAADTRQRLVPSVAPDECLEAMRRDKLALWRAAEARVTPHVHALRSDPERYRLDIRLRRLDVPALVMTGRQDTRVGFEQAFGLVNHLPRGTFATIDGAEHDFPYEERDLFVALVTDWLRRTSAHLRKTA